MADEDVTVRYGAINFDLISGWLSLAPEDDRPFWAVNLMKYREVAAYEGADGSGAISGREADDAYSPLGPLGAIGAKVALHGDVLAQPAGNPQWDRVGIVNYPTRRAFFAMQQTDDFKRAHKHKDAGMEFTIVLASAPRPGAPVSLPADPGAGVVMRVRRLTDKTHVVDPRVEGTSAIARLDVEGVIVGDERAWDDICFDTVIDEQAVARLAEATDGLEEQIVVFMQPTIDRLVDTIETPADGGSSRGSA